MAQTDKPALFDVAVVGAGLAGLSAALALSRIGARVALVGPVAAALAGSDPRTSALFAGAVTLLANLGILPAVATASAPLRAIRIIDDTGRLVRAPEALFRAEEIDAPSFGTNIANGPLGRALATAVLAERAITTFVTPAVVAITTAPDRATCRTREGLEIPARLVVGADGRNSLARTAAGIACDTWRYPQTALACTFTHTRPHDGISNELHRPAGPLTTVPMPGLSSSLVWVEDPARARALMALSDIDFSAELETRLGGILGAVTQAGPRALFDLSGLAARALGRDRIALVGEAAHAIPPIGAQGLNLGLRDVAALADCVADGRADCGAPTVLAAYSDMRRADILSRTAAVDLLNRALLSTLLPAQIARSAGLHALTALGPLRRLVMREGMQPQRELPRLMRPQGAAAS